MALIPPQPKGVVPGSGLWNDWIEKIRTAVNSTLSSINWTLITGKPTTVAGYGITDAVTSSTTLDANRIILGNGTKDVIDMGSLGTTTTVLHGNAAGAPTFGAVVLTTDISGTLPVANGGTGVTALSSLTSNPTASVGLSTVNGSASSFMRSDAAPALSQSIAPSWSSSHTYTKSGDGSGSAIILSAARPCAHWHETDAAADAKRWNIRVESATWKLRIQDDAETTDKDAMSVTRSGNSLTNLTYGNTTDLPQHQFAGPLYPPKDDGTTQTSCALRAGSGAPSNAQGNNGDFYFRSDGAAGTFIYFKSGGTWSGII